MTIFLICLIVKRIHVDCQTLIKLLSKHLIESDLQEIKEILGDIQTRIKRFSRQQKKLDT